MIWGPCFLTAESNLLFILCLEFIIILCSGPTSFFDISILHTEWFLSFIHCVEIILHSVFVLVRHYDPIQNSVINFFFYFIFRIYLYLYSHITYANTVLILHDAYKSSTTVMVLLCSCLL